MTDDKSRATQSGTRWWLTRLFVLFLLTGMAALLDVDFVMQFVGLLTAFWIPVMIGGGAFVLGALIVMWLASRPDRA